MDFVAPKGGYGPITGATQLGADIDGEAAGDQAGHAVALNADGTVLALGHCSTTEQVVTRAMYACTTGQWWLGPTGADIDYEAIQNAQFGAAVDVNADGTIVVIGAPWSGKGITRVYEWSGSGWDQMGADLVARG